MTNLDEERTKGIWPQLFRYFRTRGFCHEDSEDLTQETLVRVWRQQKSFDDETHLRRYVFVAAKSLTIKRWRKRKVEHVEIGDACDAAPGPSDSLQTTELESALRTSLTAIPTPVCAFLDPDREPPTYIEAAARSGIAAGALRTAVCRTRKRLRRELAELLAA